MFLNTTITVQNQAINQLSSIQIISENLVLIVITINTVPSSLKALPKYFSSIFRVISRSSKILDVLVTSEYFTYGVFDSYGVVELRKEVEAAVEKKVSRLVKPGPVREAIMVPWRLDKAGRPPNVGVMAEVEAALGTVLGAETPAEGFRKLVSRQSTGAETAGGSWAGVGVVQHRVHDVEGAGAEAGEEED